MARFGRSAPILSRPHPRRGLTIGDDFTTLNQVTNRFGSSAVTGGEFFSNAGAVGSASWSVGSYAPMESDDMEVSLVVGSIVGMANNASNDGLLLYLGFDVAGNGAGLIIGGNTAIALYKQTAWNPATHGAAAVSATNTWAAGDRFTLSRVNTLYTATKNGVSLFTPFDDTTNIVTRGTANRLVGVGCYNANNGQARNVASFTARSLNNRERLM